MSRAIADTKYLDLVGGSGGNTLTKVFAGAFFVADIGILLMFVEDGDYLFSGRSSILRIPTLAIS